MSKAFEKTYDIDLSMEVVTPHATWGKPLAGGPLSVFFAPNISHAREVIELAQRFELDYETVLIDRNWDTNKWGLGDFYDLRGGIWDDAIVLQNLENAVCSDKHFDVMFIPGVNGWRRFSDKAKEAILRRVKEGAGLIINQPQHGVDMPEVEGSLPAILEKDREDGQYRAPVKFDPWLQELCPLIPMHEERYRPDGYANIDYDVLGHEDWTFNNHYINKGFPACEIDFSELGYYPYKADGDVIINSASGAPIAAVKTVGKGRVIAFGYLPKAFMPNDKAVIPAEGGCFDSLNLAAIPPEKNVRYETGEYFYAFLGRAMMWASGRDKNVISSVSFKDDGLCLTSSANEHVYRIKNDYDELVAEGVIEDGQVAITAGAHGNLRFEILAKVDGKVAEWQTYVKKNPIDAAISFALNEDFADASLNAGDIFNAAADFKNIGNCTWELNVLDDFEHVLWTASGQGEGIHWVEYTVEPALSLNLRAQAKLITPDGFTLVKIETPRVVVIPVDRGINDFEAFLSPVIRGNSTLLNIIGQRMRDMGVTGLYPGSYRSMASSGADGLGVYWYKRAQYISNKEDYLRTGDKKYLCRKPCLNDPEFWIEMEPKIEAAVTKARSTSPVAYFANDEGSLTCYKDELEFCFCDCCMSGIRIWLKEQYGDLAKLNAAWKTNYENWDQVMPDTYDEAFARGNYQSWGDHRLYMELVFAGVYEKLNTIVRRYDDKAVLRMSGCQESSAYTGCDYYELHKYVGYFEAYGGGNQMEFHRSFIKPGTILGGWTGYGVSGITARHQIWFRVLHGLTLHSLFWFYSNINPDYTYPKTAQDLAKPLIELRREGIGKLLLHASTRDALGIAMHYSMRSVHGAYAHDKESVFSANREGWVNLLEDCGYQYNFIATPQIEAGELAGYSTLILPYSIDLSEKEVEAIKAFANGGGVVIGDFQTGVMNNGPRCPGTLDEVFGVERRNIHNRKFFTCQEFKPSDNFSAFEIPKEDGEFCLPGFFFAEEGIRTSATSKAAYYQDFAPALSAVVVNDYGKGKGIYLNIAMDAYVDVRKTSGGAMRSLIKVILDFAGATKFCSLTDPESGEAVEAGHETVYYSAPGAKYVAVLRDAEDSRAKSHDGLIVGGSADDDVDESVEDLRFNFYEKAHIYDVREGRYLGETDNVDTKLAVGDVKILAILPEKLDRVECAVPAAVTRGDSFDINIAAVTASGKTPESSVFAVEMFTPCGARAWEYCENAACEGKAVLPRKLPYNAALGAWTVVVKDTATGVKTEVKFEVK
ncbi:MAG: beta-galactosidase [Defluviitaleaceae bacterium]|nr:beta-galactosidase [Defluviitaleaceae bacterium]